MEELAKAQGVHWWTVTIPEGHEGEGFGIRFMTPNGPTEEYSGVHALKGGEKVKIVLFLSQEKSNTVYHFS